MWRIHRQTSQKWMQKYQECISGFCKYLRIPFRWNFKPVFFFPFFKFCKNKQYTTVTQDMCDINTHYKTRHWYNRRVRKDNTLLCHYKTSRIRVRWRRVNTRNYNNKKKNNKNNKLIVVTIIIIIILDTITIILMIVSIQNEVGKERIKRISK